jgi:hypothetical protein
MGQCDKNQLQGFENEYILNCENVKCTKQQSKILGQILGIISIGKIRMQKHIGCGKCMLATKACKYTDSLVNL